MVPFRTIPPALFGVFCLCLMGLAPLPASAQSGTPELIERLQIRISDLEKLVVDLTGKVEEANYQNKQLGDRIDKLEREMRARLNALEETGPQTQPSTATTSKQTPTTLTPPRAGQAGGAAIGATTASPGNKTSLPKGSEEDQYNYAFSLLNNRDFAGAEQALTAFIAAHPKSRLTGNAQYWLGETYYARGDFEQAAMAFMKGYQNYPGSSKGADNLLKLGMTLGKLGKKNEACAAYARITNLSPPPARPLKTGRASTRKLLGVPDQPPLSSAWFARRLKGLGPFEHPPCLAVGVSGGPDSLALLALLCDWAFSRGGRVLALCFDHRLRDGSTAEANLVVKVATSLGAQAQVLTWDGPKPSSHIQDTARRARLDALMGACESLGILHLFLAHHGNDQAETVQMRLAHQSRPDGLAAMPWVSIRPGVRLIRPLLDRSKADLLAVARARNLPYVLDPSNENPRFERGRLRMTSDGVDQAALWETARTAGSIRRDGGRRVSALMAETLRHFGEGLVALDWDILAALPPQDVASGLSHLARSLSGSPYLPKPNEPSELLKAVAQSVTGRRTWGGCLWERRLIPGVDGPVLVVQRECRGSLVRNILPLPAGLSVHWDGRYKITASMAGLGVRALGRHGLPSLGDLETGKGKSPPLIPWGQRPALPAIVACDTPDRIMALPSPCVGYVNHQAWRAFVKGADAPTHPLEAVNIRYLPVFPILERGLRLETDAKGPYIP